MKSNYKRLGNYIAEVNIRNSDLQDRTLLGVSIQKVLMPSIANIIGTDMSTYKYIRKNQFAYGPVTSRNGDKISIALLTDHEEAMISQAYTCFDIVDKNKLLPEYLMMWFSRPEFDRYARFMSHGSAREIFGWEEMCNVELPIPTIEKQNEIVKEYHTIVNRIKLNEQLNQKLEETAQAIYKQWFVDFEFPDEERKPYKSSGGEMELCPELEKGLPTGWEFVELNSITDKVIDNRGKTPPLSPNGEKLLFETNFLDNKKAFPVILNYTGNKYVSQNIYNEWFRAGHPEYLDILVGTVGAGIPHWCLTPKDCDFCIAQNIVAFRIKNEISPFYVRSFFSTTIFKSQFSGRVKDTAQPSIRVSDLKTIKIIKPPVNVVNKYKKVVEPIFETIRVTIKEEMLLTEIKSTLISKLAQG